LQLKVIDLFLFLVSNYQAYVKQLTASLSDLDLVNKVVTCEHIQKKIKKKLLMINISSSLFLEKNFIADEILTKQKPR
jgi:hypothetical protein